MLQKDEKAEITWEGDVYTCTHPDWTKRLWVLKYQWKIMNGFRALHYAYFDPKGKEMHSDINGNIDEDILFSMFRAWVFHRDSKLFHVEIGTVSVMVEKKVVSPSVPSSKGSNGAKVKAN